jgi:glycosyltransferase involved in cell wall biosynthesis
MMKICIVAEGCYPYVVGGVSGWINSMINAFPNVEFEILAIISNRDGSGRFAYELPKNVTAVYEAYLDDYDWDTDKKAKKKVKLNSKQYNALRSVVMGQNAEWKVIFDLFSKRDISIDALLMGEDFFRIVEEFYNRDYSQIVFSDFLWTMRSIYLPLFLILGTTIPKADIYHCVATGYAGILGGMAKHMYRAPLMVSEHGIYTREREEEILKASWVGGIYKGIWIEQFRKMSKLAYESADIVTSLYGHARELQIELGCPEYKTEITPNGIIVENFENLPGKHEDEVGMIQIGAVLRVTPIKDVKTMIQAFSFAKEKVPNLRLFIMGPVDEDEVYAHECYDLVRDLGVKDVVFTGRINVKDYLGRMDMTILTSISEGQPLTILESFAAGKPVIATDVGNCQALISGEEGDDLGEAGILTHIMNTQEISDAMIKLALSDDLRTKMGEVGYQRVCKYYRVEYMRDKYSDLYDRLKGFYKR